MSIKYGSLTIMYNNTQSIFTNFLAWINKENKYIFLFDDEEICEYDKQMKDSNYYFCNCRSSVIPLYFEKQNFNTYFYNKIKQDSILNFTQLFNLYKKYDENIIIESKYNSIFYCHKRTSMHDVFGLIRIKSTDIMPRFQFAYDSNEFTKEEIIYLIHKIVNKYTPN